MNLPKFYVEFIDSMTHGRLRYFCYYVGTYLARHMNAEGLVTFINNFEEEKWHRRKKNV